MDMLHRSIAKLTRLCVNQDAKVATIRATLVAALLAGLLLLLMSLSSAAHAPDFTTYKAGEERKEAFFDFFLPLIEERNEALLQVRSDLIELAQKPTDEISLLDRIKVNKLAEQYDVENFDLQNDEQWQTLLRRIDIVPASLALAQAANESAWGTSRFARQANNFFGHWCFEPGCGVVPEQRSDSATHEVADFFSPAQAVKSYIHNLNAHPAYQDLRAKRAALRDNDQQINGLALVTALDNYSERGEAYVSELTEMIRYNDLLEFDDATAGD